MSNKITRMKSWLTRHGCAIFVVGVFLVFCFGTVLLAILGPAGPFYFSPIIWSPDGSHLAFGVGTDYDYLCRLNVIDADGDNRRKLVDTGYLFDEECEDLSDFRWTSDSTKIYYRSDKEWDPPNDSVHYYVVDIDSGESRRISEGEFLSIPKAEFSSIAQADSSVSPVSSTDCDEVSYFKSRVAHPNGLIAQSTCDKPFTLNSNVSAWWCSEKLQVCDSATGELVFTLDKGPMQGWLSRTITWGTGALVLISVLILFLGGYLSIRQLHRKIRSPS